jgi:uncharacterized Zn finger protein (UPF0148 family)
VQFRNRRTYLTERRLSQVQNRSKISTTAELIRRGASILQEACPRCGAVQIKFKGKIYCTNEDDLDSVLNPKEASPTSQTQGSSEIQNEEKPIVVSPQVSQSNDPLRRLLEEKLNTVSKQLESTTDIVEQGKLLDLVSKYVETLEKLKKSTS